jgi:hypothetical protein
MNKTTSHTKRMTEDRESPPPEGGGDSCFTNPANRLKSCRGFFDIPKRIKHGYGS